MQACPKQRLLNYLPGRLPGEQGLHLGAPGDPLLTWTQSWPCFPPFLFVKGTGVPWASARRTTNPCDFHNYKGKNWHHLWNALNSPFGSMHRWAAGEKQVCENSPTWLHALDTGWSCGWERSMGKWGFNGVTLWKGGQGSCSFTNCIEKGISAGVLCRHAAPGEIPC